MAEPALARSAPAPAPAEASRAARRPPPLHTAPPVHRLSPAPAPAPAAGTLPAAVYEAVRAPGGGEPLPQDMRVRLSVGLGVDVAAVRVHRDGRAQAAARSVGARAFAYGTHVFLGPGESALDLGLVAHEVAHVVQQQPGASVQAYGGGRGDGLEREAASAAQSVRQGERVAIVGRTQPRVQRSLLGRAWGATGGRVVHAVEEGVEAGVQWLEDRAWSLVRRFAPELEPILRQGIVEWLKEKIGAAIEAVWNTLMAPVRSVTDFIASLRAHFRNLVDWMREAAGKLARGDCSSIAEAAQKVHDVVAGLAAPVIDRVKHAAKRVGDFFTGLWERFGAPVWQWLQRLGGAIWERIRSFASWLWEKTQPIRDALSRAWNWIKDKLGIGSGPEGQNGLLQWVQRKAGEAWDWLKARVEPYKRQLLVIAGVLVMLSPAGPVIALGAAVGGLIYGARWLAQHLRSRDAVVRDRGVLEGRIIPGIQHAVDAVAGAIARAAAWLTDKLQAVVGHFSSAAGAIAGSILRFALGAITWLLDRFRSLAAWASEQVQGLAGHVRSGLGRLRVWIEPLLGVLRALGRVIANVFNIVALVLTRVWNAIPACIRDPIVDFVTNQILRRVPIFSSLLQIPNIWARIRATAMRVIRQVFRDGDLAGAAMTVFRFLLDVLQVPVDLVRAIFAKAASVLDLILADPLRFLRNVLSALKQGFVQFFASIGRHLLSGVVNWLFGQLRDAGVTVPSDLSFGSIFRLVLDVLGITLDRVLSILARKVGQPLVDRIRRMLRFLTGAWEFVSRLITEGPAGLWRYLVERLSNLWDTVRDMIIGWITTTIIGRVTARILSMLDPTGIMAVVNSIIAFYRAVQSALEYLRQILEIVNRWLDTLASIAAGAIAGAATMFENLLDRALPVAIGFLANQVGLRGLGRRIHEMIAAVQARVESGIEWLIDRALATGRAILERLGLGPSPAAAAPAAGAASASFGEGSERHTVSVVEVGGRPRTMIATTPTPARQAVDEIIARIPHEIPEAAGRQRALQLAHDTRDEIDRWENPAAGAAAPPAQGSEAYVTHLAGLLGPLYGLVGHPDAPETVMQPPELAANGMARAVEARPLTRRPPAGAPGQATTSAPIPSDPAMRAMNAVRQMWVKLHLISFRLHGRDQSANFAPGTKAANDAMERVEWEAIEALRASEGRAVWAYRTEVTYRTHTLPPPSPDARYFPRLITMRRGPYDPVANRPLPGYRTTQIESPSPTAGAASLSSASIEEMVSAGVPRALAQTVYDGRVAYGRPYRSADDLIAMIALTSRFAPARVVGGRIAAEAQVDRLNDLLRAGTVVWRDQEAD